MSYLKTVRREFTILHRTQREIKWILYDLFDEKECKFKAFNNSPFIIDCGAHIGLTTLYFKYLYPKGVIFCFEPNPNTFNLLLKNIKINKHKHIYAFNSALDDEDGETHLYGKICEPLSDTRGNSIISNWGERGKLTDKILVKKERLSRFINQPVDFLKVDIEGAEYKVLPEISSKLHLVKLIMLEFHHTQTMLQDVTMIKKLLEEHGFYLESYQERDISCSLPEYWNEWVNKAKPTMGKLRAYNKRYYKRHL